MDFCKTLDKIKIMSIICGMKTEIKAPHGRETYIADFGEGLVMKRPLPEFTQDQKDKWLKKQHRTKDVIDGIKAVNNPVYNIPRMLHIKDDEYQLLEERAHGEPLTANLYQTLTGRQRYEIVTSLAHFLVDMNESKPVSEEIVHKISDELKMQRLQKIIDNKMPRWFNVGTVKYMSDLMTDVENFEYITLKAWSHCDLNSGNVLYDSVNSKLYFIDFAEANYNFIFCDIFSPLAVDLEICKLVYEEYFKLHDKDKYRIRGPRNPDLQNIMRYRTITVLLKRFIKAGDDLRMNPQSEKTVQNNGEKIQFMNNLITRIQFIEKQLVK